MCVVVLGYYGENNIGDDLLQIVLHSLLSDYEHVFLNPVNVSSLPKETKLVIVGGGDLINDYFMKAIRKLIGDLRVPVYGIGLGFPYPGLINKDYLSIFDVIITRTKRAYKKLVQIMPGRVFLEPDLVYCLQPPVKIKTRKIGIFFANSIWSTKSPLIMRKLVDIVEGIASIKSCFTENSVVLYSMNISGQENEDDTYVNKEIMKRIKSPNVFLFEGLTKENILSEVSSCHSTVCTRFHAHVLSILCGVPFVSLYSTEKVRDLLETEDLLDYSVEMEVDSKLRPTDIDVRKVLRIFNKLDDFPKIEKNTFSLQQGIKNLLFYRPRFGSKLLKYTMYKINKYLSHDDDASGSSTLDNSLDQSDIDFLAKCITFAISKKTEDTFTWGLKQQLNKPGFNIEDGVRWILNSLSSSFEEDYKVDTPVEERTINLNKIVQKEVHRSGWAYVVENLNKLHNPNGILFDTYLDKTFGWEREFLEKIGVLPFKKSWMGILHHTFDREYSPNNVYEVVTSTSFKKSLKRCKGLIVLSSYLKKELSKYVDVPIHVLYHPTEFVSSLWKDYSRVIQIGAWLRDPYAIYALPKVVGLPKVVLKGKFMENYFPPNDLYKELDSLLNNDGEDGPCRSTGNKFVVGMIDDIKEKINSVTVFMYQNNEDYDKLLSSSVVFLKLIDASACNTIIECIVRNTPILINRIPAVIEYLGEDYPLYYDTYEDAYEILQDKKLIKSASKYLKKKDKGFLKVSFFMNELSKLV